VLIKFETSTSLLDDSKLRELLINNLRLSREQLFVQKFLLISLQEMSDIRVQLQLNVVLVNVSVQEVQFFNSKQLVLVLLQHYLDACLKFTYRLGQFE